MVFGNHKKYNPHKLLGYFFNQLDIKVSNRLLKQLLEENMKYKGSIRGIKEILNDLEIESRIFRLNYNDLLRIECPLIAHLEQEIPSFIVLSNCSKDSVSYFDSVRGYVSESISIFLKKWSGVILVPLISKHSGDPEFKKNLQWETTDRHLKIAFTSMIIIFLILTLLKTIFFTHNQFIIGVIFFFCKTLGTVISILIIKIEFGDSNSVIRRICNNFECKKVLHSTGSKIFSWLSMGDIGMVYFSGGLLLFTTTDTTYTFYNILALINIFTLPYTVYSIFYQWRIAKAFCPFCSAVIMLLWTEFFTGLFMEYNCLSIGLYDVIHTAINYLLIIVVWSILKSYISKALLSDNYKTVLSRIKKDIVLFESTLNAQPFIPELSIKNEITLGDCNAKNILIAVISPSCDSCHQLYLELKSYSQHFPERLKIILRFKGFEEEKGDINKVIDWIITEHLLGETINSTISSSKLYESWNVMKFYGLRKWEEKNQLYDNKILPEAIHIRQCYVRWIKSLDIPGVPAMIFNGKILPILYTFNDIKYLIRRIYEK